MAAAEWRPNLILCLVILVAIAAFLPRPRSPAAPASAKTVPVFVTPGEMRSGSLLLKSSEDGRYVEAPRLGTDIDLTVSGPTVRARVTQIFHNPTDGWVEAVYVYPLPEDGAVDTLKMVIGDRIIVGEIKERQKARAIYEQAKAAGQKATLIEQERPNIFTNSVANIGPGETVLVQIEYQEPVRQSGDVFSLRVPLVVGAALQSRSRSCRPSTSRRRPGLGHGAADPVPDRDRIEPPVLDPREHAPVNPVHDHGAPAGRLPARRGEEPSPPGQDRDSAGETRSVIKLAEGPVPADRDFELTWKPAAGAGAVGRPVPRARRRCRLSARLRHAAGAEQAAGAARRARSIFVIDNSGSMGGTSMVQAKASLIYALGRLRPADRFNVIRFDDTMDVLFPDTVPADAENVAPGQGASSPRCRRAAAPRWCRR